MPEHTPRLSEAVEDRYRIERELGEGGMATVYLAEDLKHRRKVAIKVLRPELAAIIGGDRFLAEIEVTAQLQHPHILPLFDSGKADGFLYYVMPYVEGESLRDRLEREKQLPIDEAVRIGAEVADALDYAHRQGVIHRDVKPGNVLLHDGRVLVADFGIALAVRQAGGARLTETGLSMGTPHYMSPEQATADRDVDARSDVYSLGAMVYEMLAGRPPHTGASLQSVIASVLTKDPPRVDEDRPNVGADLAAVVHGAIERLPADRFQTAAEFRAALEDPSGATAGAARAGRSTTGAAGRKFGVERTLWAAAVVVLLGLWLLGTGAQRDAATPPEVRFSLPVPFLPLADDHRRVTISSDGSRIVFVDRVPETGFMGLYERPLGELDTRRLLSAVSGASPSFSPDGRFLAWADGDGGFGIADLERGGEREYDRTGPGGSFASPTWGPDGMVYVAASAAHLTRVDPETGAVDTLFSLSPEEIDAGGLIQTSEPLPGGRGVIYQSLAGSDLSSDALFVWDAESGDRRRLLARASAPHYLPFGVLLFQTPDGDLRGVEFDPDALALVGEPRRLESGLRWEVDLPGAYAVSENGVLAYEREVAGETSLVWLDGNGAETPVASDLPGGSPSDAELSPDGSRMAYVTTDGPREEIWIHDFNQRTSTRFTTGGGRNNRPAWTPDGERISFVSDRDTLRAIYTRPANMLIPAVLEVGSDRLVQQITWNEDGASVYREGFTDGGTDRDLLYRLPGDTLARPFVVTPFDELAPTFSPDGRWVAYVSTESGRDEIYVRRFPGPGARLTISSEGGAEPAWSGDGRTLYYRSRADSLVAVRLAFEDGTLRVRQREVLFSVDRYVRFRNDRAYTVHPDEERFVFVKQPEEVEFIVVTSWFDRVREIMGIEGGD